MPVKQVSFDRPVTRQEVERLQAMAKAMRERPKQQVGHPLQAAANFANDAASGITDFIANRREQKRREALVGALQGKTLPGLDPEMFASMMNNDPDQAQQMYINAQIAAEQARREQAAQAAQWQRQQDAQRQADDRRALQEDMKAQRDRDWGREDYLWQREQSMPKPMTPEQRAQFGIPENVGPVVMTEKGPQLMDLGQQGSKPTDDMREYQLAQQQGYQGTFQDYMVGMKRAGAPSNIGSIPPGYQVVYDDQGRPASMQPIPGSPVDVETQAAQQKAENREADMKRQSDLMLDEIDRAMKVMDTGILPDTGFGAMLSSVPGTDAKALAGLLETIKANISFNKIQEMRANSPTGGALGNVSDRDMKTLAAVAGSLDQSQDSEQLRYNLERLRRTYNEVVHGIRPDGQPVQSGAAGGQAQGAAPVPDLDEETQKLLEKYGAR